MIASSFLDPMLGIDIHWELVPTPAPVPTPIPNPFTGIVFDPVGLAAGLVISNAIGAVMGASFKGPVLYWTAFPATNTGTEGKHVPGHILIPPGTAWAPVPKTPKPTIHPGETPKPPKPVVPDNDAVMITGSKTVHVMGSNACRIGDLALSCSEPVRLPSTVVLPVPKGAPILIGGPPTLDLMAAALASLRTRFIGDSIQAAISRLRPSRFRSALSRVACFFTGHPVDVATGKLVTSAIDAELPGPLPFRFERVYHSSFAARPSPLGHGWSHSLDQAVWEERGKVVLLDEEGREVELDTFDLPGRALAVGEEAFQPIDRLTFRREARGAWRVTAADGTRREFAPVPGRADGRAMIRRIVSRDGHHEMLFDYDARGRLEWVRDASRRLIGLEHDARDRLVALKLPLAHERGFYVHRRFEHDAEGDLVRVTDSAGSAWRFEYVTHLMVRETDRVGLSFYFEYDGLGEDAWCTRTWGDGGIYDHVIRYDKKNHVTYVTDSRGHTTQYHMNAAAMVVAVVDPLGARTEYEYDMESRREVAVTDPLGAKTQKVYDARGDLVRLIGPDGATLDVEWDGGGSPVRVRDPLGHEHRYAYDREGHLVAHWRPDGTHSHYEWQEGLLRSMTDGAGHTTVVEHDSDKQVSRVVLPNGAALEYRYDRLGRLVRADDPRGGRAKMRYDAEGRLLAHEGPLGLTRQYRYDAEGNLTRIIEHGREVVFAYTGLNWFHERTEAGATIRVHYDTEGRVVGIENPAGERYELERDRRGRIELERGLDGSVHRYARDLAGRVIERTKPSGLRSRFSYDLTGRLTGVQHSDGSFQSYSYRMDGALVEARNEKTQVCFDRDPLGRIVAELVDGREVRSRYGASGARVELSTSLGAHADIERGVGGTPQRMVLAAAGEIGASSVQFLYDDIGRETGTLFGNGIEVNWRRDEWGRPIDRRVGRRGPGTSRSALNGAILPSEWGEELSTCTYQWVAWDRLSAIIDPVKGPRHYDHDARGRLVRERRPTEVIERAMDLAGNVLRAAGRAEMRYGRGGRLESDGAWSYTYDQDGNRVGKSSAAEDWHYLWDAHGLLSAVQRPSGDKVEYEYDAFARRRRKRFLDPKGAVEREVEFVWDGDTVVHEIDTALGVTTWYWKPETFTPVVQERGVERWHLATDHLGAPTDAYDDTATLVWSARMDAMGASQTDLGSVDGCRWRWPGQYHDSETGLHYNRWRYYDAETGAYVSQDPLRYAAGISAYGYAEDVNVDIDPYGLHIASGLFTDSNGASHDLGRFDSSGGRHSEPKILDAIRGRSDLRNGSLEIVSLGPRGDGSTGFFRSSSGKAFPAGPLPPCGPRAANCDALLRAFAQDNGVTITYRWSGNVQVYHPDGRVTRNGEPRPGCG